MQYCKHCGTQLADDAKVCAKCGAVVESANTQTVKARKNIFCIVGFILSFVGLIAPFMVLILNWSGSAIYILMLNCLSIALSVTGIVTGSIKKQAKALGVAGLIIGLVGLVTLVMFIFIF